MMMMNIMMIMNYIMMNDDINEMMMIIMNIYIYIYIYMNEMNDE